MKHIEVGILGATGMVGQQFVRLLEAHPWFRLTWLGASDRSVGKPYADAAEWRLGGGTPAYARAMPVFPCTPGNAPPLLFSSMDASVATAIEREFAQAGHVVVSNSRNHRMEPDVPLLIPEINADHLSLVSCQRAGRKWSGMIVTNPNCSTVVLAMALAPMIGYGIQEVFATTMQAVSGAGYPGVPSYDILGNVVPFISGEEEKMQSETQKILGTMNGGQIVPLPAKVSAQCNRVPALDGHTVAVSVRMERKPAVNELIEALTGFQGAPQRKKLPSAPAHPLVYLEQADRPQPRRDASREAGMAVSVGRLRPCPIFDYKFVACGHNTIRGAAGAAVLNAELLLSEGLIS